jgi:hypothetical protein
MPVDITVYLPDDLGQRAKDRGVNLSRMLRDALADQFAREDAMAQTLTSQPPKTIALDLVDPEDRGYKGTLEATRITDSEDPEVYLTAGGKVILYDPDKRAVWEVDDPEQDLRDLPSEHYLDAMDALGIVPTVDLMAEHGW